MLPSQTQLHMPSECCDGYYLKREDCFQRIKANDRVLHVLKTFWTIITITRTHVHYHLQLSSPDKRNNDNDNPPLGLSVSECICAHPLFTSFFLILTLTTHKDRLLLLSWWTPASGCSLRLEQCPNVHSCWLVQ